MSTVTLGSTGIDTAQSMHPTAHVGPHVVNVDLPDGVMSDLVSGDDGDGASGGYRGGGGGCFSTGLYVVAALLAFSIAVSLILNMCNAFGS